MVGLLTKTGLCLMLVLPILGALAEEGRLFRIPAQAFSNEAWFRPLPCLNGGVRYNGTCACPPGFYGLLCGFRAWACALPCQNGGTCDNWKCVCPPGFYGEFCEYRS
uniref:Putative delta-like 1 n=1 Tax=Amblyomma triste TaxID=251400 RepID=A0A023G0G3_AMBTT